MFFPDDVTKFHLVCSVRRRQRHIPGRLQPPLCLCQSQLLNVHGKHLAVGVARQARLVGHDCETQHLHAERMGGDSLAHRRHADIISAEDLQGAHFRCRLVRRPQQASVHALDKLDARIGSSSTGELGQIARVGIRHRDERAIDLRRGHALGACQRVDPCQVQLIGDETDRAGLDIAHRARSAARS